MKLFSKDFDFEKIMLKILTVIIYFEFQMPFSFGATGLLGGGSSVLFNLPLSHVTS